MVYTLQLLVEVSVCEEPTQVGNRNTIQESILVYIELNTIGIFYPWYNHRTDG